MKKSIPFYTFLLLSVVLSSHAADISGKYICKGHDPFANINYKGATTVIKSGQTYQFTWDYGKKMVYHGTGLFNENEKNMIAVVFADPNYPQYTGVQIYQLQSDGSLVGNWTIMGKNEIAKEICKKTMG